MEAKAKAGEEDLSMEEILQSIRKIIAEDGDETPAGATQVNGSAAASDVLELTDVMEELPAEPEAAVAPIVTVADSNDILNTLDSVVVPETTAKPAAAPAAASSAHVATISANDQSYIDSLLSSEAATATAAAFKKIQPVEPPLMTTPSPHFRSGGSVEDLVMEALRPMLKQWLDLNLPHIVERIVEREIKKLVD